MGGRGSEYLRQKTSEQGLQTRAEEIHRILKESGMPAKKSIEETKDMLRELDRKNGYTKAPTIQSFTIGGRTMRSEKEIDNYYNERFKKDSAILETNKAMNSILGTSGGFRLGNRVFNNTSELKKYYDNEAKKSKEIFKKL